MRAAPPPPRVNIPEGNVPGIVVDQGGQGGWHTTSGLPSLNMRPTRALPSLASTGRLPGLPSRPKLTLASVTEPAVPTLAQTSTAPILALSTLSPGMIPGNRSMSVPTPASAGLPRLVIEGQQLMEHDEDGVSGILTPRPGTETVRPKSGGARSQVQSDGQMGKNDEQMEQIREGVQRFNRTTTPKPPIARDMALNSSTPDPHLSQSHGSRNSSRPSSIYDNEVTAIDASDLVVIRSLGEGAGGAVELVRSMKNGSIMARKTIARTPDPAIHRQIVRELAFLSTTSSDYIVEQYGAFLADHNTQICILMEYCEAGSLETIIGRLQARNLRCSEHVLGYISRSVLRGLDYLKGRNIIHRDIKPSNILVTIDGEVKLCDFGVSGELVESHAGTYTGTSYFMAPERLNNLPYSIVSDVWSFGLTLYEVAHLKYAYGKRNLGPIELIQHVLEPAPTMIDSPEIGVIWSNDIRGFMALCLTRDPTERPKPAELLDHPFIVRIEGKNIKMDKWIERLMQPVPPPASVPA
ncbi:hypothetical protein CcaverHIS002_0311540 [Cutaneotrichosporon cavernicola]|uniref:mitogen-activated protein kinase kinase n=1 Tax=Cutaneotrichosporon cavernicola TaxID=279322 RepID=A0AA48L342_9TREE|nr:uncharacterized protein CcaverHIS019_0311410 [Cutaneotrichosporon cavernicola]BEI83286.1 hypothetical protein CcaverHIS002_0311540 [Cutaneotrichosporon cavernicola]BEI91071.1 hypothetical protein CcaverHIS019_0311410 [Cutaneotrichosporon cavernicola]BEI98848.1 hypothetical protein CcaverHIS631_0311470 [Cutaneotrichosporon cavernicola]BEJ06621.1 hypothetical protein CcaverHIS641_0311430 [Cutaneotrichosporon cavernicola]